MEKIYTLQVDEISPLIKQAGFSDTDYMLLEKIDCINLKTFNSESFEKWDKGIIFSRDKELKWRSIEDKFYVVYSGDNIAPPENFNELTDAVTDAIDFPVILWGQRSKKMKGFPKDHYIEIPIPKELQYPIESAFRVKISLRIQKNKKDEIIGYRFSAIEEV